MELFSLITEHDHEQVVFCHEPSCGYRGIIAIHNSVLGPALGGTRFWSYASDQEAFIDALRLSRGMTYKAAVAGLNLGGGKSVIIGDPRTTRREEIFRAHGRFVETLRGRYITAEDVGTSPEDMEYINMETQHVVGLPGTSGDPSPVTAYGVYRGMKAAAQAAWGSDTLAGKTVAVQGVGHVGYYLCQNLAAEGARLVVTDIDAERVQAVVQEFGAQAVAPDAIYGVDADIYAPSALGATLNDRTIPQLKARVIAGAANNQLAEPRHGDELHRRGIVYAPDYVVNAGGLINVCGELNGWAPERSMRKAGDIYNTLLQIFELADSEGIPTYQAADRVAERRISAVDKLQRTWV
ncbi:MAG TPA: Glu/Leu/Phe/Val dehydrogenase dimerization domain-containing protein [Longimicrobiaceae bacterium]|nr:Glu/Leu/Phe/Val dehydrogenase dimerization domain-containing protein [Longimicrobiaceae bacterium]